MRLVDAAAQDYMIKEGLVAIIMAIAMALLLGLQVFQEALTGLYLLSNEIAYCKRSLITLTSDNSLSIHSCSP